MKIRTGTQTSLSNEEETNSHAHAVIQFLEYRRASGAIYFQTQCPLFTCLASLHQLRSRSTTTLSVSLSSPTRKPIHRQSRKRGRKERKKQTKKGRKEERERKAKQGPMGRNDKQKECVEGTPSGNLERRGKRHLPLKL
mmetsp:Transcript_32593/g.64631  ORF Transcript_32593/g.64631 Transcript_32593/m.64631 type:complete len:139 (-) Transcript_32593:145-561(-)